MKWWIAVGLFAYLFINYESHARMPDCQRAEGIDGCYDSPER